MTEKNNQQIAIERIQQAAESHAQTLNLAGLVITLPPEIVQLTSLMQLYLGTNQLTSLPPEIGQLTSLRELYLGTNQLTSLPPEIGQLTSLTLLSLSFNQLTSLPSEISQLTCLTLLSLSENQLASYPSKIGQLTSLTQLDLRNNQLTSLPPEIGQLTSLTELYLRNNQLTSLPPEIGQLTSLTQLDLRSNQLTSLPPEISQLTSLTLLSLSENQLASCPSEIGQLTSLTELDLYNNQLTSLPPEIGQLTSLTLLDLRSNQLTSVPPEIGQLTSLRHLSLSENQLTSVPPEISQLTNLPQIDLSDNQLTSLPPQIAELRHLRYINLQHNPLELAIPAKWLKNYPFGSNFAQEILTHYQQMHAEGGRPLGEARVLVVGEADAGKTKLLRALLHGEHGKNFKDTRNPTDGIAVDPMTQDDITLRFWDFGGQELMHATHRFFLSRRCIYVLVADATSGREYNEEKIEYWLELIKFFGGDSPVLLVASKSENFSLNVNERGLQEKYPNLVKIPALQTSAKEGTGIETLRSRILEQAKKLASVSVMLPKSFLAVKDALEELKSVQKLKVIRNEVYTSLCEQHGITEPERQDTLLQLLHDMGVVLHYEDDRLSDFGILNPDWATGGVYKIVNSPAVKANGSFKLSDLKDLLNDEEMYPANMRWRIVELMKKFELTYEIPLKKDTYILPSALNVNQPALIGWDDVPTMTFEYRYPILQVSVLHRFMVLEHQDIVDGQIWYSGVALLRGENQALIKADFREKKITIRIKGAEESRKEFLYSIRMRFEYIHGEEAKPAEYICHPQYPGLALDFEEMKILAKTEKEYKSVYNKQKVIIKLSELLDGFVTPEEQRKDAEKEQKESGRPEIDRREGNTYITHNNINVQKDVHGNIILGNENEITQTTQNSFNEFPTDLQNALVELIQAVKTLQEQAQASEQADIIADELEYLEKAQKKLNKDKIKISVDGLKQAAQNLNEIGKPVFELATQVIALLNSVK